MQVEPEEKPKLRKVRGYNFSRVQATPLENVKLAAISVDCFRWLGLKEPGSRHDQQVLAQILSGNRVLEGSVPLSHCYCGHQFGEFSGQLGDGRAISIGDVYATNGELVDLQLKGSGPTPYSRSGDGRAVLRSSIREFLASEYMYSLGIPTTRALSLVSSDSTVQRDPFFNGNVRLENCAVVTRLAPTFLRFGSFEIFKERDRVTKEKGPSKGLKQKMLKPMLDYLLSNFFKDINEQFSEDDSSSQMLQYNLMFEQIVKDTAQMVALWQCYGFCHGVLNTDNMSILSLTLDYGPFQVMEHYDPDLICNHTDLQIGRYKFKSQPDICKWNLKKLAEALHPYVDLEFSLQVLNEQFDVHFNE